MEKGIPMFNIYDGGFLIIGIILMGVTLGVYLKKSLIKKSYVLIISIICGVLGLILGYAIGNDFSVYKTTIEVKTNYQTLLVLALCIFNPIYYSKVNREEVRTYTKV
ncbi:MAG: hypothetical protein RR840_00985 [Clostridium sp.]